MTRVVIVVGILVVELEVSSPIDDKPVETEASAVVEIVVLVCSRKMPSVGVGDDVAVGLLAAC